MTYVRKRNIRFLFLIKIDCYRRFTEIFAKASSEENYYRVAFDKFQHRSKLRRASTIYYCVLIDINRNELFPFY